MIIYIPWTDETLLLLWEGWHSYLIGQHSCERGTINGQHLKDWGWIIVGQL